MAIEKFEDIRAWQHARKLTTQIYQLSNESAFAKDFRFRDQIRAASVSIMANIAEGFDSSSDAEFLRFLSYARRSATEVQSHLYVAIDQSYITKEQFATMYEMTIAVKNLISGFMRYLHSRSKTKTSIY
jgi:four helix bundle protein